MKGEELLKILGVALVGLVVINAISQAKWCGPSCQVILSDARGTLVQDVVTGALSWI